MHLEAIRDGAGPDVDILLDLNFNAKTEGYLKILRAIAEMDMFWVEIDTFNPEALGYIRRQSPHPISSCETLLGLREFQPYFREQAMDVAIIDTPWNGVWQSMKIANAAEHYEVNVAPHNFYGHLCSMMNAHFCAAVPNLRIMETDIDRLAWDHELFTHVPEFVDGHMVIPDRPGWGTEPNEEGLRAHPPKSKGGLLSYGQVGRSRRAALLSPRIQFSDFCVTAVSLFDVPVKPLQFVCGFDAALLDCVLVPTDCLLFVWRHLKRSHCIDARESQSLYRVRRQVRPP